MTVTMWDLTKAVGLAILQINAATLAVSIIIGPLTMLYEIWQDWKESR